MSGVSNFQRIRNMNIDELAQFLFVNQFSKCSHCAYYGDICNGEFFDAKSCTEGIKRFLSSDDDVDLRMQEFRAKVASGEHVNNAAFAQWWKKYNKGESK